MIFLSLYNPAELLFQDFKGYFDLNAAVNFLRDFLTTLLQFI